MNDDLISRSALKKAMWDESYSIATFTECGAEISRLGLTITEIEHIIDNAQPVEQECYITGAQWNEFMKEHKRPQGERWIPVSERLPYNLEDILVTIQVNNREPKVRSGFYAYGIFNAANGDTWSWNDPEVKAWMPLPEPYKEEENERA